MSGCRDSRRVLQRAASCRPKARCRRQALGETTNTRAKVPAENLVLLWDPDLEPGETTESQAQSRDSWPQDFPQHGARMVLAERHTPINHIARARAKVPGCCALEVARKDPVSTLHVPCARAAATRCLQDKTNSDAGKRPTHAQHNTLTYTPAATLALQRCVTSCRRPHTLHRAQWRSRLNTHKHALHTACSLSSLIYMYSNYNF